MAKPFFIKTDSSKPEDNQALVEQTIKQYGALDIASQPYWKKAEAS
ncbi:MAG: hypothetical protein ICV51_19385 [Flavisolibacter sp.]|nr:hypothetical protein [Flavisolibacter sp.]